LDFVYLRVLGAFVVDLWMVPLARTADGASASQPRHLGLSLSRRAEAKLTKSFLLLFSKKKAFLPLALARARYLGSDLFFQKKKISLSCLTENPEYPP
jgi:hypothetical protein